MAQYRRSVFLINKKFQFRFSLYVCTWLIALSFIYPLIVYSLFEFFFRYASMDPAGPPVQTLLNTRQEILVLLILLQVIFLVITFLISIFMSHRIAGPLFKLQRFFSEAKAGHLQTNLLFREKDHFQDLARDYNEMMKGIRSHLATVTTQVEQALPDASPKSRAELEKALTSLRPLQR